MLRGCLQVLIMDHGLLNSVYMVGYFSKDCICLDVNLINIRILV